MHAIGDAASPNDVRIPRRSAQCVVAFYVLNTAYAQEMVLLYPCRVPVYMNVNGQKDFVGYLRQLTNVVNNQPIGNRTSSKQ